MADDSLDIESIMEFHPCDRAHGMKDYVLKDLTPEQQTQLNSRKREQIRTDQKYLAKHPEVRGLIIMILRILMRTRPKFNIYETIGEYFTKSSVDVKEEIYNYLDERNQILSENSMILQQDSEISLSRISRIFSEEIEPEDDERSEKLVAEDDMTEADAMGYKDENEDKEMEERPAAFWVRWEGADEEETMKEHRLIVKICQEVLNDILNYAFDEADAHSIGSIASVGFPVDYEDHAYGSEHSESDEYD